MSNQMIVEPVGTALLDGRVLRDIARRDQRFDLFQPTPARSPAACITRPVIVAVPRDEGHDRMQSEGVLVWGYRYVQAPVAPGRSTPPAVFPAILVDSAMSAGDLLELALVAEDRAGSYSWPELDRIVRFCDGVGGHDVASIASLLDPDRDVTGPVSRYQALPPVIQPALEDNLVDIRTAERLAGIDGAVVTTLLELSSPLSFSRRRQFLTAAVELSRSLEAESLGELLRGLGSVPGPARFDRIMRRRYPRLRRMEDEVQRVRETVLRGTGVNLDPPPQFEGGRYRVSFDVSSVEELRRRLRGAHQLEKTLDGLLDLLFQDALDDPVAP